MIQNISKPLRASRERSRGDFAGAGIAGREAPAGLAMIDIVDGCLISYFDFRLIGCLYFRPVLLIELPGHLDGVPGRRHRESLLLVYPFPFPLADFLLERIYVRG